MTFKLLKFWPLIVLLIATFLLRIYKIEELLYFTYDESVPAFVGRRLALWGHIPLIGGVTPFNFHLAPYFYWFLAFILILGKLNPISWGVASAILAMSTTFLIFLVGTKFFNRKVGFTGAIFWSFSYLANIYDRHLWALYWGPLLSMIVLFSLYKLIKGKQNYIFLLAGALAFGIHSDPSNLVFIIFTMLVWFLYNLPFNRKTLFACAIILFSFLPLIIFDLRHNFANTKPVLDYIRAGNNNPGFEINKLLENTLLFPRAFSRLVYPFGGNEIAKQYSYCPNFISEKYDAIPLYALLISSALILTSVFWGLKNKKEHPGYFLIGLLTLVYFLGIHLYGTILKADIFEHYITGLFAVFLLIFARFIILVSRKVWLVAIAIFIVINFYKLTQANNSMGLLYKKQAISYTMEQVGDSPFSLDSLSTCWKYSGYRYLFTVFGREPVKSYVDPNFGYLYGTTPIWPKHPEIVVSFVIHDFVPEKDIFYKRYAILKSHEISSKLFGNIEAIIIDNSSGWFD